MALPDEPKTDTSSAPPPPKKPPAVSADELFGQPAKVSSPAQTISNRRIPDISDDELVAAFKDKPLYVLDRVNWNKTKSPYRKRLENLIAKDPSLQKILDYVLPAYPQAAPQPKPQAAPAVAPGAPPPVTAAQIVQPAAQPAPGNNITAENAPKIEAWMNGLKDHIFKSFAQPVVKDTARRDVRTSRLFTQNLLSSLSLYRGGLAGFYLSEGSKELIFSALGPIGDAFRSLYLKDVQRKMSWMKHPLNPDAIYYYLQSLPNQMAFKLMYLPAKATFGILARGGAPLISQVHYQEFGQTKQSYVFTPLLKAAQFSNKLADKLDKLSGVVTDDVDKYWGEKSRYKQYIEGVNQKFGDVLKDFKNAKASGNKTLIKTSRNNIKDQLNLHDGKFGQAVFKNGLKNFSRRLRHSSQDPVVGLFALITGTLIDISVGLVVNFARAIANKIINVIPGLNTLHAQMIEYFTSNRVLTSLQMSGTTVSTFLKGTFSPTTFSHSYLGYRAGELLAPNAAITQIMNPFTGAIINLPFAINPLGAFFGTVGFSWGAFYTASLKMLNPRSGYFNPQGTGWVQKYDKFLAEGNLQAIEKGYLKGFKPGPFSRFASRLYKHPFARLPINGFVVGDILSGFMETRYGWNPWVTRLTFAAADYLWQIKGPLLEKLGTFISQIPWVKSLIASIQFGITFPLQGALHNLVWRATAFEQSLIGKMPVAWEMRAWAKFAQTFFNPGLIIGWGVFGKLFMGLGVPGYLAGPLGAVAGSLTWNLAAFTLEKIFGTSIASMSRINAAGWAGYMFGSLLQLLFPTLPAGFGIFTSLAFIGIDMALLAAHTSLLALASGTLSSMVTFITGSAAAGAAAAASLAAWSTVIAIGSVTLLTVFFAYTVYAGFWVPMIAESQAGPASSNFSIQTEATCLPNSSICRLCSSFDLSENVFSSQKYLDHNTDFIRSDLTVNLNDPAATTDAFRGISLDYTTFVTEWVNGTNYSMIIPNGNMIDDAHPYLDTFLPTPTNQPQNLFELMQQNSSVVFSMKPFFDILTSLAEEYGKTQHLVTEYEAQLDLMKEQKKLVDDLIKWIEKGNLGQAKKTAEGYKKPNPMGSDPCPVGSECPAEKQGLNRLYDSWENTVQGHINTIDGYLIQTDPNLDNLLDSLEQESEGLKQQIAQLPEIIKQMKGAQEKIKSQADADAIINANFSNFTNMTLNEQNVIWALLAEYFPEVFDKSKTFYFIPQGTNYRVCIDADYSGRPDVPQTVCSTISYQPSIWGPNTAFAKHCTTFTPK